MGETSTREVYEWEIDDFAWTPQPGTQSDAISARWCYELLFGGARGGGKSDFLLGDYLQDVPNYQNYWRGILFRRTMPELEEIITRSHEIYPQTGATWKDQKKTWIWPNGATLKLRYLERVKDATRYQGHQYTWIGWDELGQWPDLTAYHQLKACLRQAGVHVPVKRIRATANPGGAGHHAVKSYFIDDAPGGFKVIENADGFTRMFIPSRVTDNLALLKNDPTYVENLKQVGSPELVRAWLEGDWSVIAGAYFTEFSINRHVIKPRELPKDWIRFTSMDWGSAAPFVVQWFAVSDGTVIDIPKGALIMYREWYGGKDGVGLKLTAEQIALGISNREKEGEQIKYRVCDPSMFKQDGGESFAERFKRCGITMRPADNDRISGWDLVRHRLVGNEEGEPMLLIFDTCKDIIRTLPALQHDEAKPEDIDTTGDDHSGDTLRYGCKSRPWFRKTTKRQPIKGMEALTLDKLYKLEEKYKRRRA